MSTIRENDREKAHGIDASTTSPTLLEHEREVLEALRAMQYGTLEITVHQSRIVQITRSEKLRF